MDGSKGLSDYEKERLKRIEENRKMLDELFPDGTGLHVNGGIGRDKESTPETGVDGVDTGSPAASRRASSTRWGEREGGGEME